MKNKNKFLSDHTNNYLNSVSVEYRKSLGQYFTPQPIVEMILKQLPNPKRGVKVLDPACGTGEFLNVAKKYFRNPNLYGWDIDKKLTKISSKIVPKAKLKNLDTLFVDEKEKFDFIIGNPPYYEFSPSEKIRNSYQEIFSGRINIFGLFIYKSIKLLKDGGYLAFVVPPSMNNGAYFSKLREYIINNCNIEYLKIINDHKMFSDALQTVMLLILKKGKNNGDYIFHKNGITIFSENAKFLEKAFRNKDTLHDLGYTVRTGRIVWNQNKDRLTDNPKNAVPLVWAHNITQNGLKMPISKNKKPQYIKINAYDTGPALVVNRIIGSVNSGNLKAALIPSGMKFVAENHVNVIFPFDMDNRLDIFNEKIKDNKKTINEIFKQITSVSSLKLLRSITGNTQISKSELENLFPVEI